MSIHWFEEYNSVNQSSVEHREAAIESRALRSDELSFGMPLKAPTTGTTKTLRGGKPLRIRP